MYWQAVVVSWKKTGIAFYFDNIIFIYWADFLRSIPKP